jgi:quercetin dioxygenase-like cupin family protein
MEGWRPIKEVAMGGLVAKSLDSPDERREFPEGYADIVTLGETTLGRGVFEPGWRWSEHIAPVAGTESCQAPHTGYVLSGAMRVVMDDGQEGVARAGDAFLIPPGHDAWVEGDEPCVVLDWTGMAQYAKPR